MAAHGAGVTFISDAKPSVVGEAPVIASSMDFLPVPHLLPLSLPSLASGLQQHNVDF